MRFASRAEAKPHSLIQPLEVADLEELDWKQLARKKLARAWEGEEDALYAYLRRLVPCTRTL